METDAALSAFGALSQLQDLKRSACWSRMSRMALLRAIWLVCCPYPRTPCPLILTYLRAPIW
jgi:hypothetical protein